jgi:hypothetical protein
MVNQVTEPAPLDLKTLPVTVPPVPGVTQRPVVHSLHVYHSMNQSQKSLLENLCQGNHEAGNGQKSDVGFGVPVIPGD